MGVIRGYVGGYKGLGFPQIRGTFLRDPDDKDYSNYSKVYIRVRIFLGNDLALIMLSWEGQWDAVPTAAGNAGTTTNNPIPDEARVNTEDTNNRT